jgi:hypothetical protein
MGTIERLARDAGVPIQFVGRQRLVDVAHARCFPAACAAAHVLIVGIEGFVLRGANVEPT